ncbi:MAG TPA: hypothetical protein VEA78_01720, partial [Acidimicrobiales bacterium]|nr:hypothetical protein [Acidimicrobiales bacterium]
MSEHHSPWRLVADDVAVRTNGDGTRSETVRHAGETIEAFRDRLHWGRMDDLAIAYAADQANKAIASTLGQYRSEISTLLMPLYGETWLVHCDDNAYDELLDIATTRSYGHYDRAHRTLGAVITWAVTKKRWPKHVQPFGGADYRRAVHKQKMRDAPARPAGTRGGLISLEDCPTFADIRSFGDVLGDAAASEWGEPARTLGELPVVQYVTGA